MQCYYINQTVFHKTSKFLQTWCKHLLGPMVHILRTKCAKSHRINFRYPVYQPISHKRWQIHPKLPFEGHNRVYTVARKNSPTRPAKGLYNCFPAIFTIILRISSFWTSTHFTFIGHVFGYRTSHSRSMNWKLRFFLLWKKKTNMQNHKPCDVQIWCSYQLNCQFI